MKDVRRVAAIGVALVVILRLCIGWQFLYEGLWKLNTLGTTNPWTAEGYLRNAQGPFRETFRGMSGDPDDLNWLSYDKVDAKWSQWHKRYVDFYDLTEQQQKQLDLMLNGPDLHVAPLRQLPDSVDLAKIGADLKYEADKRRLILNAATPLLPREVERLKSIVDVELDSSGRPVGGTAVDQEYYKAVQRLRDLSYRLSYRQRLAAQLKADPDRVGVIANLVRPADHPLAVRYEPQMGTPQEFSTEQALIRYGEIQQYKNRLVKFQRLMDEANLDFEHDHASRLWSQIQADRAKLVGPVKALDAELRTEARELLSPEQLAKGAMPPPKDQLYWASRLAMLGLIGLGVLLLLGLFTKFAAVSGALMLLSFYLVWPPWPGVPEAPGPEHSFIVDKNLIEVIALLAIAALPTGLWFGIDGLFLNWWYGRKSKQTTTTTSDATKTTYDPKTHPEPTVAGS